MKYLNLFVILILTVLLSACCKKDFCDEEILPVYNLEGDYCMISSSGGIQGAFFNHTPGLIGWRFDSAEQELIIENYSGDINGFSGLESGVYTYSILSQDGFNYLFIEGAEWGAIEEEDGELHIDGNKRSEGQGADYLGYSFSKDCTGQVESWNLIHLSGGLAGLDNNFDYGDITWAFDYTADELHVVNSINNEGVFDGFETGVYEFSIAETFLGPYLTVDSGELGQINLSDGEMFINGPDSSQPIADGFTYHLVP